MAGPGLGVTMLSRVVGMLVVVGYCRFDNSAAAAAGGIHFRLPSRRRAATLRGKGHGSVAYNCRESQYSQVCREGSHMVYAQTMFGACSPVGCVEAPGGSSSLAQSGRAILPVRHVNNCMQAERDEGISTGTAAATL